VDRGHCLGAEDRAVGQPVEEGGVAVEVVLDRPGQERLLVVPGRPVALDVEQPHVHEGGTDILVLELDRRLGTVVEEGPEGRVVFGVAVRPTQELGLEHGEVIGD
jgi:hypothetical protein